MRLRECGLLTRMLRTRPLCLASLMYLSGCILAHGAPCAPWMMCCALAALAAAALACLRRGRRWVAPLLVLCMLPLGALRFGAQWEALAPVPEQKDARLSGRIVETPVWNPETERCICVLGDVRANGAEVEGRLRLYLRGDALKLQSVRLGQRVDCEAHIWEADPATNPGQFDFANYLRLKGLRGYATAEIESAALSEAEYRPSDLPARLRERVGARIDRLFPKSAALARAFLLGDQSGLSDEERESYANSGAAHLLAISGMNVSVLAAAVNLIFARFLRRRQAFGATLALLLAYAALIGLSASLARAILMFVIFSAAPLAGRASDPPTRLAAALLVYLLFRPIAVLESGFILSFGASAGIMLLRAPLTRLVRAERYLRAPVGPGLRNLLCARLPRWALSSLIVTAAAQLAILPAVIHFFGAQPLWSFAVNLVAAPLSMAGYLCCAAAALTGLAPLAALTDLLFGLLTDCARFFGALPLSTLRVARFPLWLVLACALAQLLATDLCATRERLRRVLPLAVLPAVLVSNLCAQFGARGCSVVFLDAGQADCAVLRAQGRVYLIDAGDAYTPAADYLSAMNYALDGVFLSHPHADHAGGLAAVLEVCTPQRVYLPANWGAHEADAGVAEALDRAVAQGAELVYLSAGDELALSEDTILRVLSPQAGIEHRSANDDSMILRVEYGDASALFCGDASAEVAEGACADADMLKVGHHGGKDALSAELLARISPSAAILTVGYNNYGHPSDEALKLLDASGARVYRSDQSGALECRLRADGTLVLRPYRPTEAK